jgi:hypothetical protein
MIVENITNTYLLAGFISALILIVSYFLLKDKI